MTSPRALGFGAGNDRAAPAGAAAARRAAWRAEASNLGSASRDLG